MNNDLLKERARQTFAVIEHDFSLGDGFYRERMGTNNTAYCWALGVLLSAFVAGSKWDRSVYRPLTIRLTDVLNRGYWDERAPVGGYNAARLGGKNQPSDRYYDDNAWLAIAFHDAGLRTETERALAFCRSGWDNDPNKRPICGGVWWHEQDKKTQATCATAPTAVAVLQTGDTSTGVALYDWLQKTVRDPSDGLYWDGITPKSGQIEKRKWSYNSALVLRCQLELAHRTGNKRYLMSAILLGDGCVAQWFDPKGGILKDDASFAHLLAENLLRLGQATKEKRFIAPVEASLETLWNRVRRADGLYPKMWEADMKDNSPTELLWIASAARAYAFAAAPSLWKT